MVMLTPFHFLHFYLNFSHSGFSFFPWEHFDYKDKFLGAWQEKKKKTKHKTFLIKDGQHNLYLLVDLEFNKMFYSM